MEDLERDILLILPWLLQNSGQEVLLFSSRFASA